MSARLRLSHASSCGWLPCNSANSASALPPKAYRWVAEMHEIADFVGQDPAAHELYLGAAHFYEQIAQDFEGDKTQVAALEAFMSKGA